MVVTDVIETRCCFINKIDEAQNILRIEPKRDIEVELDDIADIDNAYKHLLNNERGKFLVVFSEDCSSNKEMKEKLASKERSEIKKAEALVI